MPKALEERDAPTVTLWNRVEGSPRTKNFERALRAEVRDALWMLTRQWQTAEFKGEDGGSPILVKTLAEIAQLSRFRAGNAAAVPLDQATPLETQVEAQQLVLDIGADKVGLDIRLAIGRRWLQLLAPLPSAATLRTLFFDRYTFDLPDRSQRDQAGVCAHPNAQQSFAAVAGRAIDGYALYRNLVDGTGFDVPNLTQSQSDDLSNAQLARGFVDWIRGVFLLPPQEGDNPAWDASRFEYRFDCSAMTDAGEKKLVAEEYSSGSVDWPVFDVNPALATLGAAGASSRLVRTTLPTPVTFPGMPNPRWWTMEDGRTNFGAIRPDTTDLAKLLFIEFGLLFSNDWFLTPLTTRAGSLVTVKGLMVTDTFGERVWIEPVDAAAPDERSRFSLFTLSMKQGGAPDPTLPVGAAAPKVQESAPFEAVMLVRDEMANMVWAIEKTVPAPEGRGASGADSGRETRAFHQSFVPPPVPGPPNAARDEARIRYDLMTEVPEHWIPFVAAPDGRLQRATMLRILSPQDMDKIRPRTSLLRPSLAPGSGGFFVPQEEVPRAGAYVTRSFQRTRWTDGRVLVWIGARKQTGRGEGWSGLSFDRIVPKDNGQS
ncbi:MAG: hypothetical protein ABTQ28_04320 [Thauera sp.]